MRSKQRFNQQQHGTILLLFLITMPFLILMATYYMRLSLTSYQVANLDQQHTAAQLAADAGADYAVQQFSLDNNWTSTGGEIELQDDGKLRTTYEASISGDDTVKTIAVTGYTYRSASPTAVERSVSINVDLRPVNSGSYSVISGAGGLIMSNSSKIVGGDVLINGSISLSNSAQIGLSTTPVNVQVAHQICPNPPNATYPRVCNSGENGQPITLNNNSHIYGTVKATNQTNGSGMSNPGLVSGTVAPQDLPTYDRNAQKAAVTTTITSAAGSCSGGTKTWLANTKITGNVSISNGCRVTVEGNVWITGNLSLSNSSQMVVANTLGATRPNIMVDGSSGATLSNSSQMLSNTTGTGFEIFTFYSTASCSPDCATVTGTDLANSRTRTTISLNNSSAAPNTILYAYWTQVDIGNAGQIGALIGQTIRMSNNSTITFGTSTGTGEVTWVVKGYRRQ